MFGWVMKRAVLSLGLLMGAVLWGQDHEIKTSVTLRTTPGPGQDMVVQIAMRIPPGLHVYSDASHFFKVEDRTSQNLGPVNLELPPAIKLPDALSAQPGATVDVFQGNVTILVRRKATAGPGSPWAFQGALGYQACSETKCFMPQSVPFSFAGIIGEDVVGDKDSAPRLAGDLPAKVEDDWHEQVEGFDLLASASGYLTTKEFLAFLDGAASGQTAGSSETPFAGKALWAVFLLVLLGGLGLNLTPCVLPMIPVNLAIIGAGANMGTRNRGFLLGSLYGLSMAIVYGALGLVVVLTSATFGTLNASPWFNLVIAVIFVVLALAMLGAFNIDFSRFSAGVHAERWQTGTLGLAVFMGAVSALLAGACVAPVLIAVLVFSANQYAAGNVAGVLLPFVLGIGMGLPWPFAGAGISLMPRPGAWMVKVKIVFAVFILLMAAYYGKLAYSLFQQSEEPVAEDVQVAGSKTEWLTSLPAALREAERTGTPLFIDFWATWCKNCLTMDKTTFRDDKVRARLEKYTLLKFQAENPSAPRTKAVMSHFNVLGLPTYVVLRPSATENAPDTP